MIGRTPLVIALGMAAAFVFTADARGEAPPASRPGVTVDADGRLAKDGRPIRAIGVNYFSAFLRTLKSADDTSYDAGLAALAEHKIPFARFAATGFWPADMNLYREDKAAYFQRMDAVVKAAERHGVGLVPSLFWHLSAVPDIVGEPCDQWGNPKSKTHEFMRTYTREVVTRYKDSPAIWGWEFANEYNLVADLPNAASHRPQIVPKLGTPETRSARDEFTHDILRTALSEFAREVRRHDPYRFITSGNSIPRASAWHNWKERSWKADTPEQFAEMLAFENPDPLNVLSIHTYNEALEKIPAAAEAAAHLKKPLFIGEFQVAGAAPDATEKAFRTVLERIEKSGSAIAAMWVYDLPMQEKEFNVTATNSRAWQLKAVAEANRRLAGP